MADRELITAIDPSVVAGNLERIRAEAGESVEILLATKYVDVGAMGALAEGGVTLVGENRLQDLEAKQERWGDAFSWDFIGALQSRKAPQVAGRVRLIHSLCTDSALAKLERAEGDVEALVQVNIAGEESKEGVAPDGLGEFIARSPVPIVGLMTMPPFTEDPEASRPYFARLAELAAEHGLARLSMGTSQDWRVAVEEGATIIRVGNAVLRDNG
jgi:uncharacterized pyridoxal phosphate-containing UPF0001 family protein